REDSWPERCARWGTRVPASAPARGRVGNRPDLNVASPWLGAKSLRCHPAASQGFSESVRLATGNPELGPPGCHYSRLAGCGGFHIQRGGQIIAGFGVIRFESQRLLKFADCLLEASQPAQRRAQVIVRLGVGRFQLQGDSSFAQRFVKTAFRAEG